MKKVYELTVRLFAEEGSRAYGIETVGKNMIFSPEEVEFLRDRTMAMVMAAVEGKPDTVVEVEKELFDRVTGK